MDNHQKRFWFRRRRYGWGWTPATWQGWLITVVYVASIIAFSLTVDGNSPPREVAFTFFFPLALLTAAFIRVAYRTGEKPKWQWGERAMPDDDKNNGVQ